MKNNIWNLFSRPHYRICREKFVLQVNQLCFSQRFFRDSCIIGGILKKTVTRDTDGLVYGVSGETMLLLCHGRESRNSRGTKKEGKNILIIHENDFWDCYEDTKILQIIMNHF